MDSPKLPLKKVVQESRPEVNYSHLTRLNNILSEAQEILENLGTTVGMTGTAQGSSSPKPPKRSSTKSLRQRLKAIRGRTR